MLNLLSQNSNEIPKKKKKKRTFNSYIIQRERIKESHVRLFKIHAKFERRGKKKKKSRGEDGIRMPDKDCSRRGKHEGEDQRKDLDCPRKKKKKKKSQAIKKKKKETHPLTIDPSIPPRTRPREYLSLSLCLEGKKKKGRRAVKQRGWKACVAISRIEFLPFATVQFRGLLEMRRNFEERRGGEGRGGGEKTGASRRAWIRVPVCTLTPPLSLSGRNARWSH